MDGPAPSLPSDRLTTHADAMPTLERIFKKVIVPAVVHGIIYTISAIYSALFLARFVFKFARSPKDAFWKVKKREVPPSCLDDPALGNHCYVQIKNVKLHYVEAGDKSKPLMLFLHGFPEFWYSWRHQIKEFSSDYWTVALDMRGYGDSEKPPGVKYYKMKYLVEDVKNVLEALGRDKCTLVAHDWGGLVAWYFLQVYPQFVENYVMINAPHPIVFRKHLIKSFSQFRKSWYIFFYQMPFLPELKMQIRDMVMFNKIFKNGKNESLLSEEEMEAYKFTYGKPGAFTCPINYYRANIIPDWRLLKRRVDDVKPPSGLLLFGEKDHFIESAVVDKTKRIVHNLTTDIISGASHFAHEDDPQVVNKAIREFLKNVSL